MITWAMMQENLSLGVCGQQRRRPDWVGLLISPFVVPLFEGIISRLATSEISIF